MGLALPPLLMRLPPTEGQKHTINRLSVATHSTHTLFIQFRYISGTNQSLSELLFSYI